MSVFTHIEFSELKLWLQDFGFSESIGELVALKGIAAGITNTNYFVTASLEGSQQRYVLTIFEKNAQDELPYFVELMTHLAAHGVLCPTPIMNKNGIALGQLQGKPALLVNCLKGSDIEHPTADQCAQVGRMLAEMHIAGQSFTKTANNQRGTDWRVATASKVMDKLSKADQNLLQQTLDFQAEFDLSALPRGVIHGDLFRDNVLFDNAHLGGFIDFYYACDDVLAYDVAIAVNDWCMLDHAALGEFDEPRLNAFMQAYIAVRPFSEMEQQAWQGLLCIAALRFWLSRLYDWHYPQAGELTHAKDPEHFKQILLHRATHNADTVHPQH